MKFPIQDPHYCVNLRGMAWRDTAHHEIDTILSEVLRLIREVRDVIAYQDE